MNQLFFSSFLAFMLIFTSCTNSQTSGSNLSAVDFSKRLQATTEAVIVDVRTPQEFSEGHIKNAVNIDWNGNNFDSQISKLDKSKPIFVYCLGGGRSASAASSMKSKGFKEIYELNGGMMAWRSAGLPETMDASTQPKSQGMTKADFEKLITSDKVVIVDFFAVWCGPCKKMAPHLEEISKEMADKVVVVKINVDENPQLANELKIEGLPTLHVYKNKALSTSKLGYLSKTEILELL